MKNLKNTSYMRLLAFVKPYRGRLIIAIIASALYGAANAAPAKLAKPLMDDLFQSHDTRMLNILPLLIILVFFLKGLFQYIQTFYMRWIGQRVIFDVRNRLFEHVLKLPLSFYQSHPTGLLMSRISNDVSRIQTGVSQVLASVLKELFSILFLTINIIFISWKLAIFAVFILPVSLYPILRFARNLRISSRISQEKMADLNSTMFETFYGVHIIKAFTMERFEYKKFERFNEDFFHAVVRALRLDAVSPPLMEFIGATGAAALIWIGGTFIVGGSITPGVFMEFIASLFLLYSPIKSLGKDNYNIQMTIAAATRIFTILDEEVTIRDLPEARALTAFNESIEYAGVNFKYKEKLVLEDINFKAFRGQIIAFVGSSGAGKSTLVNLLPRFFEPCAGRILIDGTPIQNFTLKSLRGMVGMVTQDTILFNDSVANNIAFGQEGIPSDRIETAARAAFAHEFILELPKGYDTIIGERGVSLSGGQRQRITIARAILKNPPILVLDEATSSLDSESEAIIQEALNNLMQNRTTFVIAHRLSTVRAADCILVIKDGHIVERGTHDELMQIQGEYKRLHDIQFHNEG
ncbi:ATP-binding cassette domain-containing protein [bacterium]|nr:ATP-binding cassette domain-containing protein [candidate division CSSED10-310 bacterium]